MKKSNYRSINESFKFFIFLDLDLFFYRWAFVIFDVDIGTIIDQKLEKIFILKVKSEMQCSPSIVYLCIDITAMLQQVLYSLKTEFAINCKE